MGRHENEQGHENQISPVTYSGDYVTLSISEAEAVRQAFSDTRLSKTTLYHTDTAGDIIPFVSSIDVSVDNYEQRASNNEVVAAKRVLATTIEWLPDYVLIDEDHYIDAINQKVSNIVGDTGGFMRQVDGPGSHYTLIVTDSEQYIQIGAYFDSNKLTVYTEPSYDDSPEGKACDERILDTFFKTTLSTLEAVKQRDGKHALLSYAEIHLALPTPGNMITQIENAEVLPPQPEAGRLTFDSLGGLTYAKSRLQEIANVFKYPDLAAELDVDGSHFMLHGPPGTGKTTLVEIFAQEIGAELRTIKTTDIVNSYIGQTANNFAGHIKQAIADSADRRIVLFFDEFDSLADNKSSQHREYGMTINAIKEEIDSIDHPVTGSRNLILAAATNKDVSDMNDAIMSRLEAIAAPAPNDEERDDIWRTLMARCEQKRRHANRDSTLYFTSSLFSIDLQLSTLVELTDGLVGRDVTKILKKAQASKFMTAVALRESGKHRTSDRSSEHIQITQKDLEAAIIQFKKSRG